MKYISIGAVMARGTEQRITVYRGNHKFPLAGEQASVWLSGRFGFSAANSADEQRVLKQLIRMGLAVSSEDYTLSEYRTLTQCTIIPADRKHPYWGISGVERIVLQWLREAGLVLSMAELVYLIDRKVPLHSRYLGNHNAQALVERMYTNETIYDNILENHMEQAASRDQVVKAVLDLLRKKRIVLL